MALENLKFTEADFAGRDIASLPDVPGESGMTAAELKARFDYIGKVMIALGAFNSLLETLSGSGGAGEIGAAEIAGIPGETVQEIMEGMYFSLTGSGGAAKIGTEKTGGITSENVQAALAELDAKKLSRDNTTAYTPTGDYNPATKKYVDDAIRAYLTA